MKPFKRSFFTSVFILATILLCSEIAMSQLPGYSQRFKAQINSSQVTGSSSLTNFPVLVSLTNARLAHTSFGGDVENINGYDIRFTSSNSTTLLTHQIESYDPNTGEITFWVRFPSVLSNSNTEFYIYFGNSSISVDPSNVNVWDPNYKMVLHLNETGAAPLTISDAASEGTDGSDNGTIPITGQTGDARDFDTTGDRIIVADNGVSPLDISGSITISLWLNISNLASGPDILTKGDYLNGYSIWTTAAGAINFQINNDALTTTGGQISNGNWAYITATRNSTGDRFIYVNGTQVATDNSNESFNIDDSDFYLSTASSFPYLGDMDEVRISAVNRSSDWISTEFNNQDNPSAFITLINAEPILDNIESTAETFISGDTPLNITSAISVQDGDDTDLVNATIQITGNYDNSEDVLAFTDQLGITGSWNSGSGILTLSGTSSVANYQTALRSVTYENTAPVPVENTRTVSFTVNDGTDNSNIETRDISVISNIAPELNNIEISDLVYISGSGQRIVTNNLIVSDGDNLSLDGAIVEISSGYIQGEDILAFADQNGITGVWNNSLGRLELTGSSSIDNYRVALRSVTYQNLNGSPTITSRTISFTVNDGIENSNTEFRNVEYPTNITELVTYKAIDVFHFDAQDVDGDLDTGDQPLSSTSIANWGDRSDNVSPSTTDLSAVNATGGQQPIFDPSFLGGRGALQFDGSDDNLTPPNDVLLNTAATYDQKSFALMFRTGASISGLQILYEQGGGVRGYQISIKDGILYAFTWNNAEWLSGDQYKAINLGTVFPNTSYIVIASHDATDGTLVNRVWEANINGGVLNTLSNVDVQETHTGGAEIGENGDTLDPTTFAAPTGTTNFGGFIGEFISWNSALTPSDFTNIYAFLSEKWIDVNSPPVLNNIESSTITYNSGDLPTNIASSITVTDSDDSDIEGATVQVSVNYDSFEDVLSFTNQLGITGSWDSGTGILTLSGTSTVANYQTALRAITYENTEPLPLENTRTISFTVNDGSDNSNLETRDISVENLLLAPLLSNIESSDIVYFAGSGQKTVTNNLDIAVADNGNLDSAIVEISSGYIQGEDILTFTDQNGITGVWNNSLGQLIMTGSATEAEYRVALRSVAYENLNGSPAMSTRSIAFTVYEASESSNTLSRDVNYPSTISDLASYKSSGVFHFDAQDVDGDNLTNDQPAIATSISPWGDRSDNVGASTVDLSAVNATVAQQPVFDPVYFGDRGGLLFDGTDDNLSPPNDAILNTVSYAEKSFAMVFRTGSTTAGLQMLYEQGGGTRGYQLSINDGTLYAYVWNNAEWIAPNQYKSINLGTVVPNTTYIAIANHDATAGTLVDRVWEANLNGGAISTLNSTDVQQAHGGTVQIGEEDGTRGPVGPAYTNNPAGNNNFNGFIGEFISWNSALTTTDFSNIYAFLSEKWFNNPPLLGNIETTTISYTKGDSPTAITSALTVTDTDNSTLDSAKVFVGAGFDNSEDELALPAPVGAISGSYNSISGVLTLSGTETIANYQTALRSVTYQNSNSINPSVTTREINFEVYDWENNSNTVKREIEIISINSLPILSSIEGTTIGYTENDGQVNITSSITVTDSDNSNLTGATVTITKNNFLGEDQLAFNNDNGIIGSFNSSSGILSLSGISSLANYQTALRSVTYENTSSDPASALDREITFRVFDGTDSSGVQSRDISVTSINTIPLLADIESENLFYSTGNSVILTETITLIDPDDTQIQSATIQITTGYSSAEDTLIFADFFGITGSWNDGTGTLTITGPATIADFETALLTISYDNTAVSPSGIPREITFTANDGDDNSNTQERTISFSIPASIPGLLVWLKGDNGTFTDTGCSTPAVSSAENVGCWQDQSGNGNDFITSGAVPPILQTSVGTINSQNAIEFPGGGSNVRLEDADAETQYLNGLTGVTVFFVIESDVTGTDRGFWTTTTPSVITQDQYFSIRYDALGDNGGASNVITTGLRDLNPAFVLESFEEAQNTSGQIVMLKWTTENTYQLYVDGELSNPTYSLNIPSGVLSNITTAIIGQGPEDDGTSWDGLVAEMILYNQEIRLSEQLEIEDYLSDKYDISIRSLTPAQGGDQISADDANSAYTTLTGPRVQESFTGEFTSGTFVFTAPTGFEWDTGGGNPSVTVNPAFGGSTNHAINFTSRTASEITFTVTSASSDNPAEIIFNNFRVRPTTGILPNSGTIRNIGTTGAGGTTDYGQLTIVAGTASTMEFARQASTSSVNTQLTPSPRVQLIDQNGNPVQEGLIDISMSLNQVSGSGVLDGTSTTLAQTNIFGVAEFNNLIVDDIGTYSLTASSTSLQNTTTTPFDVVVPGQFVGFTIERVPFGNISNKQAGQDFNITIVAVDGAQDTVNTFTGTVVMSSNCTIGIGLGTTPNFVGGVLSPLTMSITNPGSCSFTATNSTGSESGTSNAFTVTPGVPSALTTTISAIPTVIINDGFSTSDITIQLKDSEGNNLTTGGPAVILNTDSGSLSSVNDNGDGTYSAILTSSILVGTANITGTLDGNSITDNTLVEFAEFSNVWQSQVGPIVDAQNWDDINNWTAGVIPGPTDIVLIPATPSVGNEQPVVSTTNSTVQQLSLEPSATVTISGGINFVINGNLSGGGEISGSNSDTLTVGGDLDIGDAILGYIILNGSTNQDVNSPDTFTNLEINNTNGANFPGNVIVNDSLKLTDGVMFLPTGSNLIANAKNYVNGSIRMQRRISGSIGWRLISSPFNTTYGDFLDGTLTQGYTGSTLGTAALDSLQPNVLTYLESFPGTDNQRYRTPNDSSDPVVEGQGMFVFFFGDIAADARYNDPLPDTLDVSGQEWNGNDTEVDFGITYTAAADTGWNLVGNPFAATIDWDDNTNWTKTNIESTIYIWDPAANGGDGEYLTWNGVTGTLPNSGLIAPFQGFWVKASAPSPELKVSKDAKTTSGTFLRKSLPNEIKSVKTDSTKIKFAKANRPITQIQMAVKASNGRSKKTNIIFTDEARKGKDILDAYRLFPLSSSFIEFHTLLDNGTELAINNLPDDFNSRYFIPLHFDAFENGSPYSGEFSIVWGDFRGIPVDWVLTLIDNDNGEEINMREELSYTFNHTTRAKIRINNNPLAPKAKVASVAESMDTRFTLKVSTEEIELNVPEEVFLAQNYPNPFNPSTTIPFGLNADSKVSLIVYDILGRKVATLINGNLTAGMYNENFNASNLASGVYFYRLITDTDIKVQRFTLIK